MKKNVVLTAVSLLLVLIMLFGCTVSPDIVTDEPTAKQTDAATAAHTAKVDEQTESGAPDITEPVTDPKTDPVTEPPATEPPATEPPATEPPATEPPATEPPATEPPATEPPATEPPATEPPATEPPATEPPVTEPPVTEPPVTEPPVTEPPVTEPPVTDPPETEEPIPEEPEVLPDLPDNSSELSYELAAELLRLCNGNGGDETRNLLTTAGFKVVLSRNYNKASADKSHTCAYMVGQAKRLGKTVYLVTIRGTTGSGEWYSNVDFAPSHSNDTQYAENFLACAQDILKNIKSFIDSDPKSIVVVCGHSRGAAAANLLGVLLDQAYGESRVYAYTYATPRTVRGDAANEKYGNIYNFINRSDVVTYLPLEEYGYSRAGTDIILGYGRETDLIKGIRSLATVAPDIRSYYEDKHSLTEAGLSEDGKTVFEIFTLMITTFDGGNAPQLPEISKQSDLYPLKQLADKFNNKITLLLAASAHMQETYLQLISAAIG